MPVPPSDKPKQEQQEEEEQRQEQDDEELSESVEISANEEAFKPSSVPSKLVSTLSSSVPNDDELGQKYSSLIIDNAISTPPLSPASEASDENEHENGDSSSSATTPSVLSVEQSNNTNHNNEDGDLKRILELKAETTHIENASTSSREEVVKTDTAKAGRNRANTTSVYGSTVLGSSPPLEVLLYREAIECPICFLYYPKYLNRTKCCSQLICSECFVQIKRADPHTPYADSSNSQQQQQQQQQQSNSSNNNNKEIKTITQI